MIELRSSFLVDSCLYFHFFFSYILVYDLGMWKLDLTILQVSGGMFQLKASQMLLNCGGRLFDRAIADHLVNEFERFLLMITTRTTSLHLCH